MRTRPETAPPHWIRRAAGRIASTWGAARRREAALPAGVLDALPDPVVVVDAEDRVQAVNRAVHDAFGLDPETLTGTVLADLLVAPSHRETYRARLEQATTDAEPPDAEPLTVVHADGAEAPVTVTVRSVPGAERALFAVTLREARPRPPEASDARSHALHTILDTLPDAVVAVDRAGRVIFRNRASTHARSRGDGAAAGALPPRERRAAEAVMRSGTPAVGEEAADAAGGIRLTTRIPVQSPSGAVVGLVAVSRDVTAQKAGEARLLDATRAAEAAARANGEVLATTSHEIRTLMSGVTGMTQLLLDTDLDGDQRDFVETIRTSSSTLLRVVNDVLDLSKMDAGMLELERQPYEVTRAVEGALAVVAQRAGAKGIALSTEVAAAVPETVVGDAVRVQQVLANLLTNAVKFTDEGAVRVRVGMASDGPPALAFAVEDTGIGIAPDRLDAVFEQFVQADASTARTHGGTGLGLAICRRLVGMMGGELTAESVPGGGSVFRFTVALGEGCPPQTPPAPAETAPAAPADAGPAEAPAPARSQPRRTRVMDADSILPSARVLLVEDDPVMQKVTALTLRRLGYRPTVVDNGWKGVVAVRAQSYDVVLMDVMMPVMNGLEATRQIRSDPGRHPAPAIVALTANAMEGDRERCLDAGCDDYLSKPVAPRELASTIERAIRERTEAEPPASVPADAISA